MIDGQRVLAVITARGGSKGLPGKNIRPLAGRPLIAWTIEAAKRSRYIDRVVLSSDDGEIIRSARSWGCEAPFVRPAALASDEARSVDVLLHAVDAVGGEWDRVVLLQPTSPLRQAADIDACLRRATQQDAPACVSVCEPDKSPYWMYQLDGDGGMRSLLSEPPGASRRQDLSSVYVLNGAVYVADPVWLRAKGGFMGARTVAHVMDPLRSVDIDNEAGFQTAEYLIRAGVLDTGPELAVTGQA